MDDQNANTPAPGAPMNTPLPDTPQVDDSMVNPAATASDMPASDTPVTDPSSPASMQDDQHNTPTADSSSVASAQDDQPDMSVLQSDNPFDITPERIDQLASQLEATGDPDKAEIAKDMREMAGAINELSLPEKWMKNIQSFLEKEGWKDEDAERYVAQLLRIAWEDATTKVIQAMNEETKKKWDELQVYEPNIAQQIYLLNETAKMLMQKDLDKLYEESLEQVVDITIRAIEQIKSESPAIKEFTKEQLDLVNNMFAEGEFELAVQLIYDYSHNATSTK